MFLVEKSLHSALTFFSESYCGASSSARKRKFLKLREVLLCSRCAFLLSFDCSQVAHLIWSLWVHFVRFSGARIVNSRVLRSCLIVWRRRDDFWIGWEFRERKMCEFAHLLHLYSLLAQRSIGEVKLCENQIVVSWDKQLIPQGPCTSETLTNSG